MASRMCLLCGLFFLHEEDLNAHMLNKHKQNFRVNFPCTNCGTLFNSYKAYYKHRCSHVSLPSCSASGNLNEVDNVPVCDYSDKELSQDEFKSLIAFFILQMRTNHCLSDSAGSILAQNLENFLTEFAAMVRCRLVSELRQFMPSICDFIQQSPGISQLLNPNDFCGPFRSVYMQNLYMRKCFGMVEPVAVRLGSRWVQRKINGKRSTRKVGFDGFCVPFMNSLRSLLRLPQIGDEVLYRKRSDDGFLRDLSDALCCTESEILADMQSLRIISYSDEFVVTNPLRAKGKVHKVTAFYFTLANISPHFRSSLKVIQLIALARTADLKDFANATDVLLNDFICGINALQDGVDFNLGEVSVFAFYRLNSVKRLENFQGNFQKHFGNFWKFFNYLFI